LTLKNCDTIIIVCDVDKEAVNALRNEKLILSISLQREYQYLILEKGYDEHDADVFVHNRARAALAGNVELSKLSSAKMFDAINKANK